MSCRFPVHSEHQSQYSEWVRVWGTEASSVMLEFKTKVHEVFTIMEKASIRALSILKAPARDVTFENL